MCFAPLMWLQSLVRDVERRRLLYDMDRSIAALRGAQDGNDDIELVRLTGCYHNLLRMRSEV